MLDSEMVDSDEEMAADLRPKERSLDPHMTYIHQHTGIGCDTSSYRNYFQSCSLQVCSRSLSLFRTSRQLDSLAYIGSITDASSP